MAHVHRNGEGGAHGGVIGGHHRLQPQALRLGGGQRRADDAGGVADDEGHLLRRRQGRGEDEVALILTVIIVGDDDDLAAGDGFDGGLDAGMNAVDHGKSSLSRRLKAKQVVRRDGVARGLGDALGGLARDPGARIVAQRRDGGGRDAHLPREGAARGSCAGKPLRQLHAGTLAEAKLQRHRKKLNFQ